MQQTMDRLTLPLEGTWPQYLNDDQLGPHAAAMEACYAAGQYVQDRAERTELITTFLQEHGLSALKHIGNNDDGRPEIIGISHVTRLTPGFHTDIFWAVRLPDGQGGFKVRLRPVCYNAHGAVLDGTVFLVVVNGAYLMLARQWRIPLGRYTTEVARGFADEADVQALLDSANKHGLQALQGRNFPWWKNAMRELGEELMTGTANVLTGVPMGRLPQDTGTNSAAPHFLLVSLELPEEVVRSPKMLRGSDEETEGTLIWSFEKVRQELVHGRLCDMHSIAAIAAFMKTMPRLGARPFPFFG